MPPDIQPVLSSGDAACHRVYDCGVNAWRTPVARAPKPPQARGRTRPGIGWRSDGGAWKTRCCLSESRRACVAARVSAADAADAYADATYVARLTPVLL